MSQHPPPSTHDAGRDPPTAANTSQLRVTISNSLGLHARPAMSFVDAANTFTSDIRVSKESHEVDGKSIMQMMMLAAGCGSELTIRAQGPDAQLAVEALKDLVDRKFDEE